MKKFINHRHLLIAAFLILVSVSIFFRFYNLNWGAPYYFHPDERNVASAVTRLHFTDNMNPEFFAYGSLPIYTTYFTGVLQNSFLKIVNTEIDEYSVEFDQAIIILRLVSAILSVSIIILLFSLLYKRLGLIYAILGSLLAGLNVGLIQYAHFGTFEIWLTFLGALKLLLRYLEKPDRITMLFIGIVLGLLLSVKISSAIIIPMVGLVILLNEFKKKNSFKKPIHYFNTFILAGIFTVVSISTILITSPFYIFDLESFKNSMGYESAVALGTLEVFYTGGFTNSIPILYQLLFVYPFILNPLNLIAIILLLPFVIIRAISQKDNLLILALIFFLIIFLSQAFFYVKWIRYYIPSIPFIIIILCFGIKIFTDSFDKRFQRYIIGIISFILLSTSLIFSFSYFKTVIYDKDTRIEASEFSRKNIPTESIIVSENYDLGIVPFNIYFSNITLFDFYSLDNEWATDIEKDSLENIMKESEYLILPSQRVVKNRIVNKSKFPNGFIFYKNLNENYELIYKTPCNFYCKILYLGDPIYHVEETANVFDRPTVFIYKIKE